MKALVMGNVAERGGKLCHMAVFCIYQPYDKSCACLCLARSPSRRSPFSPEPVADEEAGAMFRAALNLFRLWGVTDDQASIVLDLPRPTFARWKAGGCGPYWP